MRNDNRRAVADEVLQSPVYQLLALDVYLAGCLVQDQDFRIAQNGPCQGNPLTLSTRQAVESPTARCVTRLPNRTWLIVRFLMVIPNGLCIRLWLVGHWAPLIVAVDASLAGRVRTDADTSPVA